MVAGFILAGLVSFAAGFVLHAGAFALFAVATSLVYLAISFDSGAVMGSIGTAILMFVIMQGAYVSGVLMSFSLSGKAGRRWLDTPAAGKQQPETHRKKAG